jgi:hypothetical protein
MVINISEVNKLPFISFHSTGFFGNFLCLLYNHNVFNSGGQPLTSHNHTGIRLVDRLWKMVDKQVILEIPKPGRGNLSPNSHP